MKTTFGLLAILASFQAFAADPVPPEDDLASILAPVPTATVDSAAPVPASALPAMSFHGSIAGDQLFDLVKKSDQFARLEKELYGSPITLRVMHSLQPTAGGKAAGFFSGIIAGSSLGLIPAVTNNSLVVTYEVRVHGRELVSYSFQRSFTRAVNIWAKDETYGLGKDGLEWLKSTAGEFTTLAAGEPKLAALKTEFERYFSPK